MRQTYTARPFFSFGSQLLSLILIFSFADSIYGQNTNDLKQSVLITATVQDNPPSITLNWVEDTQNSGYTIYRKSKGGTSWGSPVGTAMNTATTWTDNNVVKGIGYEYRIEKNLAGYGGGASNGYIFSGIDLFPVHERGLCVLVIDSTFKTSLSVEIDRYIRDISEEGWKSKIVYVDRNDPVTKVKDALKTAVQGDNSFFRSAVLIGRVPVPYSGNIVPDGHTPDHLGAWPCDGYYADLDGTWTDNIVNNAGASQERNRNIPGDGKFDQNVFPSTLELGIGRIDFFNMPAFSASEEQLLRAYFDKNHAFRKGQTHTVERALVQNNFGGFAEGFGQNGWKNFTPMFGFDQVKDIPYRASLQTDHYLWSYGCGGGTYTSAGGISTTANFAVDSLQTVFTMLFGSYFGDWDSGNNFLRAPLASGATLTNAWAGRPNWMFHHMALGEPIGFSARISMNNNGSIYQSGASPAGVHTALMGDPTLNMYPIRSVSNLSATHDAMDITLAWEASADAEGYFVYRRNAQAANFILLNTDPISETNFRDPCAPEGTHTYMVRPYFMKTTMSGRFAHVGPGISVDIDIDHSALKPELNWGYTIDWDLLTLESNNFNVDSIRWTLGDGTISHEDILTHYFETSGPKTICLEGINTCYTTEQCVTISVVSSIPQVDAQLTAPACQGESTGSIMLTLTGGMPDVTIEWSNQSQGTSVSDLGAGDYYCTITSGTGKTAAFGPYSLVDPEILILDSQVTPSKEGSSDGKALVIASGGCAPYTYTWSNGAITDEISGLAPGEYCVTVTDCNGCTAILCAQVMESTSLFALADLSQLEIFPNPANDHFTLKWESSVSTKIQARLMSPIGLLIAAQTFEGVAGVSTWDVTGLPSGMYYLVIVTPSGLKAFPVVIQAH